jgi:hypothetical protein
MLEGGVVNASRAVASPEGSVGADTVAGWESLIDGAISRAQAELVAAVKG